MSCFETSCQSKVNLAKRIVDTQPVELRKYASDNNLVTIEDWYNELTLWNQNSLEYRYNDKFDGIEKMPEPRDITDEQYLKSLECLEYQCSEAKDYRKLEDAINELICMIKNKYPELNKSEEYDRAKWD